MHLISTSFTEAPHPLKYGSRCYKHLSARRHFIAGEPRRALRVPPRATASSRGLTASLGNWLAPGDAATTRHSLKPLAAVGHRIAAVRLGCVRSISSSSLMVRGSSLSSAAVCSPAALNCFPDSGASDAPLAVTRTILLRAIVHSGQLGRKHGNDACDDGEGQERLFAAGGAA